MNGLTAICPCAGRAAALIIKAKQRAAFEEFWHKFWYVCAFNGQFALFYGFRLDKMPKTIPYLDNLVKMHYTEPIETDHEVLVYENVQDNSMFAICNSTLLLLR